MKEFNLELAKQGHPVQTRNGLPARIICFDVKGIYPIVALITIQKTLEDIYTFDINGQRDSPLVLMK